MRRAEGDVEVKYPQVPIGHLAHSDKGSFKIGPFGSSLKKDELVSDGIPVVGIENIQPNEFVMAYRKFITEEKYQQLSNIEFSRTMFWLQQWVQLVGLRLCLMALVR